MMNQFRSAMLVTQKKKKKSPTEPMRRRREKRTTEMLYTAYVILYAVPCVTTMCLHFGSIFKIVTCLRRDSVFWWKFILERFSLDHVAIQCTIVRPIVWR